MNNYKISYWFWNAKRSMESLSKSIKTIIFLNFLIVLLPLSALYTFYGQSVAIGITSYALMGSFTLLFIYLSTSKKEAVKSKSLGGLFEKPRRLFEKPSDPYSDMLEEIYQLARDYIKFDTFNTLLTTIDNFT